MAARPACPWREGPRRRRLGPDRPQWRPRLARIDTRRCPVALLTGEYDYSCRPEDTLATAAAIPGAEAVIMPGLGHFPMSEDHPALRPHLLPVLERFAALP